MEQLEALRQLAEKVEAGCETLNFSRALTDAFVGDVEPYNVGVIRTAYNGSLDAAHSLHKAVLGDRWYCISGPHSFMGGRWKAGENQRFDVCLGNGIEAISATPARAWLLAIIKAKIAELEGV